jgi:hypothetical protein
VWEISLMAMTEQKDRVIAMLVDRSFKSKLACAIGALMVLLALALPAARAQGPVYEFDPLTGCWMAGNATVASCTGYPGSGSSPAQGPRIGYDPCYLAQNAMRPCTTDQGHAAKPVGVDANLVGTWQLPFKGGPWVLTIGRDGTYKFHSEARDGAPSRSGSFSASNGQWSLKSNDGYADAGYYLFQAPDIWIATGKLGAAAWLRPALAEKSMRPCASGQRQVAKSVGVDANLIGTWRLPLKGGPWVWEILRDGTYKFHSEARDGAPSHSGTFTASNGHWSLKSTTGYTDAGYYLFQAPDIWIASGNLGAGAWLGPASSGSPCNATP